MENEKKSQGGQVGVEKVAEDTGTKTSGVVKRSVKIRGKVIKGMQASFPLVNKGVGTVAGGQGAGTVLQPSFDPETLLEVANESPILAPCVECMKVNVDGLGYTLDLLPGLDRTDKKVKEERQAIIDFLDHVNFDESLTALRMKARGDLEAVGFSGWEFVRDGKGDIVEINWIPARYLRLTKQDDDYTEFKQPILSGGKIKDIKRRKKFRRLAWVSSGASPDVYYKEFGDPRTISAKTGKVADDLSKDDPDYATEVYMFKLIDQGAVYPVPRWLGALLSTIGARRAEELNYNYFENNLFVPLAILVSGGQLSADSVKALEEKLRKGKGWEEAWKFLILEAFTEEAEDELYAEGRSPASKIELKPLIELVKDDALFQKYEENAMKKGRLAFRIPEILLGLSGDYNRATAEAALAVVNAQVFGVEREEFDDFMNRHIFPRKGFIHYKFRTLSFRAIDPGVYSEILKILSNIGVLTPATARPFASEILGAEISLPDEAYINHPFDLTRMLVQMGLLSVDVESTELIAPESFRGKMSGGVLDTYTRNSLISFKRALVARMFFEGEGNENKN